MSYAKTLDKNEQGKLDLIMKVSIIIPHHNSSSLLRRLLKSIPISLNAQIIVVDDNSKEDEYKSVENLRSEFDFDLYKNEGRTAGGARNTGLKYAIGDWLIFADADDFFTESLFSLVVSHAESDADVIFFNINSQVSETGKRAHRDAHIKSLIIKYNTTSDERYLRCMYLVPWGKMYRRSFVDEKGIQYEERIAGNDMWFAVRTGVEANKIEIDERELYVCTVSEGSITTTVSKERHEAKLQATLKTNNYLRTHGCGKFQVSVLYFIAKAKQFGMEYLIHVLNECRKNRSNLFIGFGKILHYKKVLEDRQNPTYSKNK